MKCRVNPLDEDAILNGFRRVNELSRLLNFSEVYKKRHREDVKVLNVAKKNHFDLSLVRSFLVDSPDSLVLSLNLFSFEV